MNRPNLMYKRGGLNDEGGEIDEVSGNEVPVGGTKEGVRDDIDVNMSAGEFVSDEATTRYHGLKTFLGMRDEAIMGMKKMEAMGLMGNSDEATLPSDMPFGMGDLMVVQIGKDGKEKELNMQEGGVVPSGMVDLSDQQQDIPMQEQIGPVTFDEVMSDAKMEFKNYVNADGQNLMVPFIGGVPLYPIPPGYELDEGQGDEITEVPELPDPAAPVTPSRDDDDDKDAALTAYRGSKKDTSIQWDTLSNEEFLIEANKRNGFGRNLAMGVASLISPLAAVGMAGLMKVEDNKVLAMARSRLAALPQGSAQRAEYEKMIESYEARGKGLFGSIIGKIVDTLGGMFGSTDEQKVKAQNANLVANSGTVVGKYSVNGQITEAGIEAINGGIVEGITTEQYQKAQQDLNSQDPEVKAEAQRIMSNYIGQELGSYVNQDILNAAKAGIGGRTPEQTRVDLVNIAYQPSTVLKEQLDGLTQGQKNFLGYTGENYLDVIDFGREQTSQILPPNMQRLAPSVEPMGLTDYSKSYSQGARIGTALDLREPVLGMLDTSDLPERSFMTADTTSDRAALSGDTSGNVITQQDITNQEKKVRQDQVNALINIGVDRALAEASVPAVGMGSVQSFTSRDVDALEGPEAAGTFQTTRTGQTPTQLGFGDTQLGEFGGMGEQVDVGPSFDRQAYGQVDLSSVDRKNDPAYPDYYAERMIPSPFEDVDPNTGKGLFEGQTTEAFKIGSGPSPTELGFGDAQLGEFAGVQRADTPAPDYATMGMGEAGRGTTPTTVTPKVDTKTVQDEMAKQEANYMEAAFGDQTTDALQLKDVVPDTASKMSFDDAFAAARAEEKRLGIAAGTSQFEYDGKMFSTATKEQAAAKTDEPAEQKGKYSPTANKQLSGGYETNTLSDAEQDAFDAAVDRGDANVANHFAMVNRSRNKQDEYAASGFDKTVGRSLGLSDFDMQQAEEYGGSVQTAINEGRAEKADGFLGFGKVTVTDTSKSKGGSNAGKKDDDDKPAKTTTTTSSKDTNIASSGRSETQIQADINAALKASNNVWTPELNDLVSERDSARANQGSSSSSDDGGGGGGGGGSSSGGGKIVCTAMNDAYGFGSYRNAIWLAYSARHMTKEHEVGYHTIFLPLIDLAYKKNYNSVRVILENIARHRTADLRAEMKNGKRDNIGRVYRAILEPICYAVGKVKLSLEK